MMIRVEDAWHIGVLGLVLVVGGAAPALGTTGAQKCAGAKAKALGAAVLAKAKCHGKARQKGRAVDAGCLATADTKLRKRFTKAEKRHTCAGDAGEAVAGTDACVAALDEATTGEGACAAHKLKAADKLAAGAGACARKAALKGLASAAACGEKVARKLTKAVAKADRKGACTGTTEELAAAVGTCLDARLPPIPCEGGAGFATCDGACLAGFTCRPYEVFANGASVETGCSCVDVVAGPACEGATCGADRQCADPTEVCERWRAGDPLGCDHMICQPALTTPTTLPTREMLEFEGGEFPPGRNAADAPTEPARPSAQVARARPGVRSQCGIGHR